MRSRRTVIGLALIVGSLVGSALVPSAAIAASSTAAISARPQICNPSCTWNSQVTTQLIATQVLIQRYQILVQTGYTIISAQVQAASGGYRAHLVYR